MLITANHYPRRSHNRFELLVDGKRFYPVLLETIGKAQRHICIEQYLVTSGVMVERFCAALIAARQRGVEVYLLFDDYGARGLSEPDRRRLKQAGIQLVLFNPFSWRHLYRSLQRDHRKLYLVDGHTAFIGGAGIDDAFAAIETGGEGWHDTMVKIEGELLPDWYDVFIRNWRRCSKLAPPVPPATPAPVARQCGQVQISHGHYFNAIQRAALHEINKSVRRIWIATPYFITTRKLRRALYRAARRGIDVRLLLPGPHSDHPWVSHAARSHYRRLLKNNIQIFEYRPRFIHAKLILCDDWVSIGSSNLDRWNQHWNLDANQAVEDQTFTAHVERFFTQDFADSLQITAELWRSRPWSQRWREWLEAKRVRFYIWMEYWFIYFNRDRRTPPD